MRIYDLTLPVSAHLPTWPGDSPILIQRTQKMEEGAEANVTHLSFSAHVGTHVDAPYHFLGEGHRGVDQLPLEVLTGRAYVLALPDEVKLITAALLEASNLPARTRRVLFKTYNSRLWEGGMQAFYKDFVALSADGAQYLVARGIKLVGIDYLSIAPYAHGFETHRILLEAGVVIVEGLNLSRVAQGRYMLYCLPMLLPGADGAPARVILLGV